MTPAVHALKKAKRPFTLHTYPHDAACRHFGAEAVAGLGVDPRRVFKTLLVALNGDSRLLAVGIVPVPTQLDLKALAAVFAAKKAEMADGRAVERATGYVLGGVSPLGQKKRLPTCIDRSASMVDTVFVSAGKRGLQIEMAPADLIRLCQAKTADIAR